jgi:hypothetical protein
MHSLGFAAERGKLPVSYCIYRLKAHPHVFSFSRRRRRRRRLLRGIFLANWLEQKTGRRDNKPSPCLFDVRVHIASGTAWKGKADAAQYSLLNYRRKDWHGERQVWHQFYEPWSKTPRPQEETNQQTSQAPMAAVLSSTNGCCPLERQCLRSAAASAPRCAAAVPHAHVRTCAQRCTHACRTRARERAAAGSLHVSITPTFAARARCPGFSTLLYGEAARVGGTRGRERLRPDLPSSS